MRTRMYGGVRGRKTKIGGKPTFVFLLLDFHDGKFIVYLQLLDLILQYSEIQQFTIPSQIEKNLIFYTQKYDLKHCVSMCYKRYLPMQ